MKVAYVALGLIACALASDGINIDYKKLKDSAVVSYKDVDCGEWKDYRCCANEQQCKNLKSGGEDKKTEKKREKERDQFCVPNDEDCCGSDISYDWKLWFSKGKKMNENEVITHDTKPKKNIKGCKSGEQCVVDSLLKHSDGGKFDEDHLLRYIVGDGVSTKCQKKETVSKHTDKSKVTYKKKKESTVKKAAKKFEKDKNIGSFLQHKHQCGNFLTSKYKCCVPDKHFCENIPAENRDEYCVAKEDTCCQDFKYEETDDSVYHLKNINNKKMNACMKGDDKNTCIVKKHDEKNRQVEVKCIDKNAAKKAKKEAKKKAKEAKKKQKEDKKKKKKKKRSDDVPVGLVESLLD